MIELSPLNGVHRLLFSVPLQPIQTDRFQPTGFPSLGAATYQTSRGQKLLVESAQSMANRLEKVCWDEVDNAPIGALQGISHVTVTRTGKFLTETFRRQDERRAARNKRSKASAKAAPKKPARKAAAAKKSRAASAAK